MPNSRHHRKTLSLVFLLLTTLLSTAIGAEKSVKPVILVLGDSLSTAYGMALNEGWVALLQKRVTQYQIINASISGDTSKGTLSQLPKLLNTYQPSIVIIEIGGNDGLRGQSITAMQHNITQIIELSQKHTEKILLLGMRIPPNYGARYADMFFASYANLAKRHSIKLIPIFMKNVGNDAALMQQDGIHPNAKAQPILLDNVWQILQHML